mgnify:CR=1 FL=1
MNLMLLQRAMKRLLKNEKIIFIRNIIDFDNLTLYSPEIRYDLPAEGKRLVQRVDGYKYTIVSGKVTYVDGVSTGELPGRLIRS